MSFYDNSDSVWNRFSSVDNERIDHNNFFNESIETDVPGITSDGVYKRGTDSFPVFTVTSKEFNANMESYRKRVRLDGKAGEYLRSTRYNKPFYIQYTDESNKTYIRKIK